MFWWRRTEDVFSVTLFCLSSCLLEDVLKNVLKKTSYRYLLKTSWKRLEEVLWIRFEGVLKTFWRCPWKKSCKHVLKTSWKMKNCYAEDVFKTSWRRLGKQEMFPGNILSCLRSETLATQAMQAKTKGCSFPCVFFFLKIFHFQSYEELFAFL